MLRVVTVGLVMNRIISSKWFFYVVLALAVAYLWWLFGTPHLIPADTEIHLR